MKWERKNWLLVLAALAVVLGLWGTYAGRERTPAADRQVKLEAAAIMQACMDQVRIYKEELGLPISPEDVHQTGMIGEAYTWITTTSGALEAKRTTANADMAALMVQLLKEAGVTAGDHVAAGFSGSFPAMDLAVLSACAAMEVEVTYISSVGASTYGANQPQLTFPDMVWRLVEDGLLPAHGAANTMGGQSDCGLDMDPQLAQEIRTRLQGYSVPFLEIPDFEENLAQRMALYEAGGAVDCFIGVGGNITTSGRHGMELGWGVLQPGSLGRVTEESGLLERYSAAGVPVIHLLNIKRLVADYDLPYDPPQLSTPGSSAIYYETRYPRAPAVLGLAAGAGLLVCFWAARRRENEW